MGALLLLSTVSSQTFGRKLFSCSWYTLHGRVSSTWFFVNSFNVTLNFHKDLYPLLLLKRRSETTCTYYLVSLTVSSSRTFPSYSSSHLPTLTLEVIYSVPFFLPLGETTVFHTDSHPSRLPFVLGHVPSYDVHHTDRGDSCPQTCRSLLSSWRVVVPVVYSIVVIVVFTHIVPSSLVYPGSSHTHVHTVSSCSSPCLFLSFYFKKHPTNVFDEYSEWHYGSLGLPHITWREYVLNFKLNWLGYRTCPTYKRTFFRIKVFLHWSHNHSFIP